MREEIESWWRQAQRDFASAGHALEFKDFHLVVFLCHQAVEKGLKALLMLKKNEPAPPSHSLIFLGKETKAPEAFHSFLRELTPQYVLTRYPDASNEPPFELFDDARAKHFLEKTKEVIEWIGKQLG